MTFAAILLSLLLPSAFCQETSQDEAAVPVHVYKGHSKAVEALDFSVDGKTLLTGSRDGSVRFWSISSGKESGRPILAGDAWINRALFSPDGQGVVTADDDGSVKIWRLSDLKLTKTLKRHPKSVHAVAFSHDGSLLAVGGGGRINVWSMPAGDFQSGFDVEGGDITALEFSPDGRQIAVGGAGNSVRVYRADGSSYVSLDGHKGSVYTLAWSPSGRNIVSGGWDKTALVWDVSRKKPVLSLPHGGTVASVAYSPDGKMIATACYDRLVRIWRSSDGGIVKALSGHEDAVRAVTYSPSGKYMASAGEDGVAFLWLGRMDRVYSRFDGTPLTNSRGKSILEVASSYPLTVLKETPYMLYVQTPEKKRGWARRMDVTYVRPDRWRPFIRIMKQEFSDPRLRILGIAYDDEQVRSVSFAGINCPRLPYRIEHGGFGDAYPFEVNIDIISGMNSILEVEDTVGRHTNYIIDPKANPVVFTPKYSYVEVLRFIPVYAAPDESSSSLSFVKPGTRLLAVGASGDWLYIDGQGWIDGNMTEMIED